MEIKPNQNEIRFLKLVVHFVKIFAHFLLCSLLIDQIYQCDVFKAPLYIIIILPHHVSIQSIIWVNCAFGSPFQTWALFPQKWHRASELNVRKYLFFSICLHQKYYLCFCCVCSIAVKICSSRQPSHSLPSFVPPSDKYELACIIGTSVCETDGDEARNETSDPFVGFDFDEFFNPAAIIHVL